MEIQKKTGAVIMTHDETQILMGTQSNRHLRPIGDTKGSIAVYRSVKSAEAAIKNSYTVKPSKVKAVPVKLTIETI